MARRRKDDARVYKVIAVAAVVFAVVAAAQSYFSDENVITQMLPIDDLSTQGYTKVDVEVSLAGNTGVVIIQGGCYQVTASTEISQVESIANGKEGLFGPRPMTHDLFSDALDSLDVEVVMVKIIGIEENTYIGRTILEQGNRIVSLDSRPSDGLAIAVRTDAPIYMKDDLLQSQGRNVC